MPKIIDDDELKPKGRGWLGKKQPPELVEKRVSKIRGENHYLWKGGKERRPYRKMIKKDKCSKCGSLDDLLIHHKDGDHYNNVLSNLEVLCSPCHTSLHKSEYWDEVRAGEKPKPEMAKGEMNGGAKLTEDQVRSVFDLKRQGYTQKQIGNILGVSQAQCGRILRGVKWRHIWEEEHAKD